MMSIIQEESSKKS